MKLITADRAGDILGCSAQRVYELARVKIIPPGVAIPLGRQLRIDEDGLTQWLASGGQALEGGWRRQTDAVSIPSSAHEGRLPARRRR